MGEDLQNSLGLVFSEGSRFPVNGNKCNHVNCSSSKEQLVSERFQNKNNLFKKTRSRV